MISYLRENSGRNSWNDVLGVWVNYSEIAVNIKTIYKLLTKTC